MANKHNAEEQEPEENLDDELQEEQDLEELEESDEGVSRYGVRGVLYNPFASKEPRAREDDVSVDGITDSQRRTIIRQWQRSYRDQREVNMSDEKRAELEEKRKQYNKDRLAEIKADPEKLAAFKARQKKYHEARTERMKHDPEFAAQVKDKQKEYREKQQGEEKNLTPEERLERIRKQQAALAAKEAELLAEVS